VTEKEGGRKSLMYEKAFAGSIKKEFRKEKGLRRGMAERERGKLVALELSERRRSPPRPPRRGSTFVRQGGGKKDLLLYGKKTSPLISLPLVRERKDG